MSVSEKGTIAMGWETKEDIRKRAALRYRNARYLMLERCQGKVARFARTIKSSHSYAAAYISENPTKTDRRQGCNAHRRGVFDATEVAGPRPQCDLG